MTTTRTSLLLALALCLLAAPALRADSEPEKVDPAGKKLIAAASLYRRGMLKLAAEAYEEFLQEYPKHENAPAARYMLGVCHYYMPEPDYAEAIKHVGKALEQKGFEQRAEALVVLGHSRTLLKQYDEALKAFDRLLDRHSKSEHAELARMYITQVRYQKGDYAETESAAEAFLKRHAKSPRAAAVRYFLALARFARQKYAPAVEAIDRLLKEHPNSNYKYEAMLLRGQALQKLGKLDAAAKQFAEMVKSAPAALQDRGRYLLGSVYLDAGQNEKAISAFSALWKEHSGSPLAAPGRLQLGIAQLRAGRFKDARETFEQVVKHDEKRADKARYFLARCDAEQGRYDDARKRLGGLLRQKRPEELLDAVAFDHASAAVHLEQWEQAAKEFEQFRKDFSKSEYVPQATYEQAYCLHKLDKYAPSAELCDKVKDAIPAAESLAAENLFLLDKYDEAAGRFAKLLKDAESDEKRRNAAEAKRYRLRLGQCAYFSDDWKRTIELLEPLAKDKDIRKDDLLGEAVFFLGDARFRAGEHETAAETLGRYLSFGKRNRKQALLDRGLALIELDKSDAAAKTFELLVKSDELTAHVRRGLIEYARLMHDAEELDKARNALERLLNAEKKLSDNLHAAALYRAGWVELDAGRAEAAAGYFAALAGEHPRHKLAPEAAYRRLTALAEAEKHKEVADVAEGYFRKDRFGEYASQARRLWGTSLARLGKHEEASKVLARAADGKSATPETLYELAWALREQKKKSEAIDAYHKLLAKFPDHELAIPARVELANLLYTEKKYEPAARLLKTVLSKEKVPNETLAAALYRQGWCYVRQEKYGPAGDAFAAFVGKFPKHKLIAQALYQAGLARALQENHKEAEQFFAALVRHHPKHELAAVGQIKLGEVQNALNKSKDAIKIFSDFLKDHKDHTFAYVARFGLGTAYERAGKRDEARKHYERVTEMTDGPTAARAQFQIGETYFDQQKFEPALKAFLAVADVYDYPQWASKALYEAGRSLEALKQVDQAKQQYALVLEKYKDSKVAPLARERLKALGG